VRTFVAAIETNEQKHRDLKAQDDLLRAENQQCYERVKNDIDYKRKFIAQSLPDDDVATDELARVNQAW